MSTTLQAASANVVEALRQAALRRAQCTPAELAAAAKLTASVPELMTRAFCGPASSKGRQALFVATPAELAAWKASQ